MVDDIIETPDFAEPDALTHGCSRLCQRRDPGVHREAVRDRFLKSPGSARIPSETERRTQPMSQDPLIEKLAKANGNVKKLCEFFAARSHWTLAADCEASARDAAAAAAKLGEHLKVLIRAAGADPKSPFEPLVETQDSGTHDQRPAGSIHRFSARSRRLAGRSTGPVKGSGCHRRTPGDGELCLHHRRA